jgi:hypothetical protein
MRTALSFVFLMTLGASAFAVELPHVSAPMRTPEFWTMRHSSAEAVVMSPAEIARFNQNLQARGLTDDLLKVSAMAYGMTVGFVDERTEPTDEPLYEKPGDVDFDQRQNSGLDPATPVAILRASDDGQWFLVKEGISQGWVRKDKIAPVDEKTWREMVAAKDTIVVTAAHTSVYLDEGRSNVSARARMGSRFVLEHAGEMFEVSYPLRDPDGSVNFVSAYISREDAVRGYLPYKPGIVIAQAFKLLDAPYGWGDMHGDQDCSRFTQMVFAAFGIILPRNSSEQALAGLSLGEFEAHAAEAGKMKVIEKAMGGATLLRLKGHIMLYLGEVDGRLYAIHAISSYRLKKDGKELAVPLKRVVVSDLSLGEDTTKGSLLERVIAVRSLSLAK